jgi:hypothetical protein
MDEEEEVEEEEEEDEILLQYVREIQLLDQGDEESDPLHCQGR